MDFIQILIQFYNVYSVTKAVKLAKVLLIITVLSVQKDIINSQKKTLAKILVRVVDSLKIIKLENVSFVVRTVRFAKILNHVKYVRITI